MENNTNKTVKRKRKLKGRHNNLYLYVQIVITAVFVLSAVMLKNNNSNAFYEIKEDYAEFFTTDSVTDSNFSYNSFVQKLTQDIAEKYNILTQTIGSIYGKGKGDVFPADISMERYTLRQKGTMPVNGVISSQFGFRKDPFDNNNTDFHTGMDIAAAKGSFIMAAFDGTVTETGWDNTAGNYITITSDNSLQTFYCHTQFIFVAQGDKIRQGQVIATVGDTGQVTGPHLHFEVIFEGKKVNPGYAVE